MAGGKGGGRTWILVDVLVAENSSLDGACCPASATASATGEARDDDIKHGDDSVDDGLEDGSNSVDNGHED
jgi:hypothetical protein